jgi:hypothetical protein
MGNVRIYINGYEITDFENDEVILPVTWRSKLIEELNSFAVVGTKTITLPVTKTLNKALSSPLTLDGDSVNGGLLKNEVLITLDGGTLIDGYMKVSKGSIEQIGGSIDFSVISKELDFIDTLKTFTLQDIDFASSDHALTLANIQASHSFSAGRPYVYAPIDIGQVGQRSIVFMTQSGITTLIYYSGDTISAVTPETVTLSQCDDNALNIEIDVLGISDGYWNPAGIKKATTTDLPTTDNPELQNGWFTSDEGYWMLHDFAPSIRIKDIFDKVMTYAGYTYDAPFITSTIALYFHFMENWTHRKIKADERYLFATAIKVGGWTLTGTAGTVINYPFVNRDGAGLVQNTANFDDTDSDDISAIDLGTNESSFVAPYPVVMRFETRVHYYGNSSLIELVVYDNSMATKLKVIDTISTGVGSTTHDRTLKGWAYVGTGERVVVQVTLTAGTFTPVLLEDSTFKGFPISKPITGGRTVITDYLPNVTAYEWVKELALIFNLDLYENRDLKAVYVVQDESKLQTRFEDWRTKIDRNTDVDLTRVCTMHPLSYRFDYLKEDEDWELVSREELSGRYAGGNIANTWGFAESTESIELEIYSASLDGVVDYYDIRAFGIPFMRGEDDTRLNYKSRIFKIGFGTALPSPTVEGTPTQMNFAIQGASAASAFPQMTFATELLFANLLTSYRARFTDILNNGFVLRAAMDIRPEDALKFSEITDSNNPFRKQYQIKIDGVEVAAELLKVSDYQANRESTTYVELICKMN